MTFSDPIYDDRLAQILQSVAVVKDRKLRTHKIAAELQKLRPEEAVDLLHEVVKRTDRRDHLCQEFFLLFVSGVDIVKETVGEEWWRRFSDRVWELESSTLLPVVEKDRGPGEWVFDLDDEDMPPGLDLSLGHKKTAARQNNPFLLDRLLFETDLEVAANLLGNPRMTERDVVRMASRRPISPEVLSLIASCPRWIQCYRVKKALIFNPWTPFRIVSSLIPSLLMADLEFLFSSTDNLEVRQVVERVVVRKFKAMTPDQQREILNMASGVFLTILTRRDGRSLEE